MFHCSIIPFWCVTSNSWEIRGSSSASLFNSKILVTEFILHFFGVKSQFLKFVYNFRFSQVNNKNAGKFKFRVLVRFRNPGHFSKLDKMHHFQINFANFACMSCNVAFSFLIVLKWDRFPCAFLLKGSYILDAVRSFFGLFHPSRPSRRESFEYRRGVMKHVQHFNQMTVLDHRHRRCSLRLRSPFWNWKP